MNNQRRNRLTDAISLLERASDIVEDVKSDEESALDNMPENLEGSERYEKMESAVESLDDAISSISDAIDSIGEAQD